MYAAVNLEEEAGRLKAKEAQAIRDLVSTIKDVNVVSLSIAVAHWIPKFRTAADIKQVDWSSHIELLRKFLPLILEKYGPAPAAEAAPVAEDDHDLPDDHPKKKRSHHAVHH